jgi:hypothetical protein
LPAFYPYAARVLLRLVLGESLYARIPRRKGSDTVKVRGAPPQTIPFHDER